MEHASRGHARPADFHRVIEQRIEQGTSGRIHGLLVEMTSDRVVVCGKVSTYYIKQLALHAALSVGHGLPVCVENLQVA